MSHSDEISRGMVIRHQGQPYVVLECTKAQTGKQKATFHVKLRSLTTNHTTERTLDQLGEIEEVPTEVRHMQYLYASGEDRVFMDTESFEQHSLGEDVIGDGSGLLVEEETYRFLTIEGRPVSVQLPPTLVLEVVDTAAVQHAGGSTHVSKEAKLASGLVVRVPLFIKNSDKIRVGTEKHDYQGKEHQ
ncbi:MAG: elongation factor P [Planctomycetota bacterium]|jgi:elongation factor P